MHSRKHIIREVCMYNTYNRGPDGKTGPSDKGRDRHIQWTIPDFEAEII